MRLPGKEEQKILKWIDENYQIIRRLGHGGDGTVYLVRHRPTDQFRAAKVLQTDIPERRRHELNMMKTLRHPSLPQIFDVLESQGTVWLIMEYINGRSLSEIDREEITAELFFRIAGQLAEVLVYLHTRKMPVLHLDIKPTNVLLRKNEDLVLIDFGASVLTDQSESITSCYGTPGYAAPEQKCPNMNLDERADIYGFGAVLYYCLYGTAPGVMMQQQQKAGDFAQNKIWKRQVDHLLARCLQENREKRFSNSVLLYRSVRKAERKYYLKKQAKKMSAAALFLLFAIVFAADHLGLSNSGQEITEVKTEYERLLQEAESLGFVQAFSCYEKAAILYPEDSMWCSHLLGRIEEDYSFSLEEEDVLKKLIFAIPSGGEQTTEKLLEQHPEEYGALAYRIGLAYWYFYEGSGGKSAAFRWFQRAVDSVEAEQYRPLWLESAHIHVKIAAYYEKLGKQDPNGEQNAGITVYWEDLIQLWELDSLKQESIGIRRQIAKEILSCVILYAYELKNCGNGFGRFQDILESLKYFIEIEDTEPGADEEKRWREYKAAEAAVERIFADERGMEFDKETEISTQKTDERESRGWESSEQGTGEL